MTLYNFPIMFLPYNQSIIFLLLLFGIGELFKEVVAPEDCPVGYVSEQAMSGSTAEAAKQGFFFINA